ncbi:hypothetical protein Dvina_01400 [Dactylosporangium vinaceum]|uniref:Uncharacterized protein n=1 Tax=Dactylosporangium vinaceum TaxID=53362 RepID=A0ABV5MLR1_9ACTN|nr:hypothetical protein [Dactylosporangium vinaceum]UAB96914.1 hypothetical protein Dvina_01400 [Dactylosporangium vinaceum]
MRAALRAVAEARLAAALAGVPLDEPGRRFVAWVERGDADALDGLASLIEATRAAHQPRGAR